MQDNKGGMTQLHVAAAAGSETEVRELLEAGADPNAKDDNGMTPLHHASQAGHDSIVAVLLQNGADLGASC